MLSRQCEWFIARRFAPSAAQRGSIHLRAQPIQSRPIHPEYASNFHNGIAGIQPLQVKCCELESWQLAVLATGTKLSTSEFFPSSTEPVPTSPPVPPAREVGTT